MGAGVQLSRPAVAVIVCLVEDQTIVREGLKTLLGLAPDIEVVGEAADGEEALEVVPLHDPDVVLLDMRLPKLNGLGVLQALAADGALPPTIILTTFDEDSLVLEGLRAGAKGYLLKDVSLDQLPPSRPEIDDWAVRVLADPVALVRGDPSERQRGYRLPGDKPAGGAAFRGFKATGDGLVCYCYLYRRGDLERDVREGAPSRTLDAITSQVKARNCACEVRNPTGTCCLGAVRRELAKLEAAAAGA